MSRALLCLALVALLSLHCSADVYMHNPRGSNNRLNERSANRQNGDRLFDSQNNNRGGYNVGDRGKNAFSSSNGVRDPAETYDTSLDVADTKIQYQMVYYEGSQLSVEWTNQHGCGGNEQSDPHKTNCDIVLQYMCQTTDGEPDPVTKQHKKPAAGVIPGAESLRDGLNTGTPGTMSNAADTNAIASNDANNRGRHESEMYYYECQTRDRNQGLFTADQKLNGRSAKFTRQNPNGNRRGLECPEERDYYPYWAPSPWKDIAVLTDHPAEFCDEEGKYKGASHNNNVVYKCEPASPTASGANAAIKTITNATCATAGGRWVGYSHNLPAPECRQADWSRVNHLGNGRDGQPLMYNWTLPTIEQLAGPAGDRVHLYTDANGGKYAKCVLRLRYNMTTDDYHPWATNSSFNNNPQQGIISPVTNNPTVDVGAGFEGLKLAINTAQFGRTFQDRSHVFYIRSRPASIPQSAKVYNLNVRGKRGNIVQTFPAVEYDFQPARLQISANDYVHVQWTGSNTHNNGDPAGDGQAGDAGEGRGGTDRHNIAQLLHFSQNYPMPLDKFPDNMWSRSQCFNLAGQPLSSHTGGVAGDIAQNPAALDCAIYLTTSGQFQSQAQVAAEAAKASPTRFDPLLDDAPASLVGGVVMKFSPDFAGQESVSYDYMCTRNNNFSNRGQKGTIVVTNPSASP